MRLDHLLSRDTRCCFFQRSSSHSQVERAGCVSASYEAEAHPSTNMRQNSRAEVWVSLPAGWLVSTVQLSGTPDTYFYNPNNIITSILPRQEERSERSRGNASVRVPGHRREEEAWEVREQEASSVPGVHKRERVRGGCLGAEGRRRTRRPAKRSGGAACER